VTTNISKENRLTLLTVGLTAVLSVPLALPILPHGLRVTYSETCTVLPLLALALFVFRRRLAEAVGQERRFWIWMIAAVSSWICQQLVLIGTYWRPVTVTVELVDDLLYVGLYLFLVLALDSRPHLGSVSGDEGTLSSLRRVGNVVFVFGVLTYCVLIPTALDPDSYWVGIPSFTLYVVLDAYLVVRLLDGISESPSRRWRTIYTWLLATSAAWLILDTTEALMWTEVLPWIDPGAPWDLPWMTPLVTLVLAGRPLGPGAGKADAGTDSKPTTVGTDHQLGSPLIFLALLVPLLHFGVYALGLFGESTRRAHELTAFGLLLVLGGLVFAYQRTLEQRTRHLERERLEALARIEYQAYHDPLTGLPNRRLLEDRIAQAIAQADRRDERLAILFLDLNGFKSVNDTSGHAVGDDILRQIGRRLAARVRSSDTLARVGGDEFVIMATGLQVRSAAFRIATGISQSLQKPFASRGSEHAVSASIGVSVYPEDGEDLEALLSHADSAMYQAKVGGALERLAPGQPPE